MEPTTHQDERFERLHADHRRVRVIYGIAIIIVTLTVTGIVLFTPNFLYR